MKEIETDRCLLRDWKEKDLPDLKEIFCSGETARLAGFTVKTPDEVRAVLQTFIQDSKKGLWAITDKGNDKAIGWLEIHKFQELGDKAYEIGYCLNESYWGEGIMPEVVRTVIEKIQTSDEVKKLICAYYDYNERSKRVIEKCGFRYYKKEKNKLFYIINL